MDEYEDDPSLPLMERLDNLMAKRILDRLLSAADHTLGDIEAARKYLAMRAYKPPTIEAQKKAGVKTPAIPLAGLDLDSFDIAKGFH
jgi:hypothetical protein